MQSFILQEMRGILCFLCAILGFLGNGLKKRGKKKYCSVFLNLYVSVTSKFVQFTLYKFIENWHLLKNITFSCEIRLEEMICHDASFSFISFKFSR